jgi:hypothetical protein
MFLNNFINRKEVLGLRRVRVSNKSARNSSWLTAKQKTSVSQLVILYKPFSWRFCQLTATDKFKYINIWISGLYFGCFGVDFGWFRGDFSMFALFDQVTWLNFGLEIIVSYIKSSHMTTFSPLSKYYYKCI